MKTATGNRPRTEGGRTSMGASCGQRRDRRRRRGATTRREHGGDRLDWWPAHDGHRASLRQLDRDRGTLVMCFELPSRVGDGHRETRRRRSPPSPGPQRARGGLDAYGILVTGNENLLDRRGHQQHWRLTELDLETRRCRLDLHLDEPIRRRRLLPAGAVAQPIPPTQLASPRAQRVHRQAELPA